MKVALVVPATRLNVAVGGPPLNLGYLAGYLRAHAKDVEVTIIDGAIGEKPERKLAQFSPDLVGITCTTPLAYDAYRLARWVRRELGESSFVAMGGVHASIFPKETLDVCDSVVVGEGEKAILRIVQDLQSGKRPPRLINEEPIKVLDEIPHPAFDLMHIDEYMCVLDNPFSAFPYRLKHLKLGHLMTSRGCYFRCLFCWNSLRQTRPRWHSAQRVVEEIQYLTRNHGANAIYFWDDEFMVNRKRLRELAALFGEAGIDKEIVWGCQARASSVDLETLSLMRNAGCCFVSTGFESQNRRILKILKKTVTVEDNEALLAAAKTVGLTVGGSFIFGTPSETREEMLETLAFIETHENLVPLAANVLTAYPETELWNICVKEGVLPENIDYTKLCPTNNPDKAYRLCTTMTEKEFRRCILDIQRIIFLTDRIRMIYQGSDKPLQDYVKLFKHKFYWFMLFRHPRRMWKLFGKVLRSEARCG